MRRSRKSRDVLLSTQQVAGIIQQPFLIRRQRAKAIAIDLVENAVDLSAQRVVLMSGWIDLSLADQGPLVATLTDRVGHMYEPPRALMGRASNTQCVLAFGAENARDAAHARSLEDLRNVTLRPLIGVAGHGLAAEAAHDELIADLLKV